MSQRWVQVEHFAKCPHCRAKHVARQQNNNGKFLYLCIARRSGDRIQAEHSGFHVCGNDYRRPVDDDIRRSRILITAEELRWMQQIIAVVYRQLATKHHPDHGGKTSDMQNLNAIERLWAGVSV